MNKSIFLLLIAIITCTSCKKKEVISEIPVHKFHIPTTISEEAQHILNKWSLEERNKSAHLPKANAPIEVWEQKQKEFQSYAEKPLPKLLEIYQPTIDTLFKGGIRAISIRPKNYKKSNKVVIYIHGGAFTFYPADVTLLSSVPLANKSGLKILSIDYTLAPQAKFNQISNEVISFYQALLKQYEPGNIAFYGDSAGAAIAVSSILKMRDQKINLPGALVLWSGWFDIHEIGDSYFTLKDNDPNLVFDDFLENCAEAYAPKSAWKNPYVSPIYGDYTKDFPPTLIQVGSKEIFLSNSIRLYRNLIENNKTVSLDVYEGMWHVWQGYYTIPESKIAINNTKKFIFKHLNINPQ
ncbi:alpha/beta hydrolase fold domain-containing protein [Flavicella sediminum]|uniref:alpha/beta hydrolase fold domain-containing protein n=1 Tax=Flavicella sediminum TaxID=2585141 RepID=UPI00140BCD23|nr:alpha/beta hydrolase [Flavicella sediminum]